MKPIDALNFAHQLSEMIYRYLERAAIGGKKVHYIRSKYDKLIPDAWVENDIVIILWAGRSDSRILNFFQALGLAKSLNECVMQAVSENQTIGTN